MRLEPRITFRVLTGIRSLFLLACFVSFLTHASAATFSASLDKSTLALGESAVLSLTFEGGSPKDVPVPPAVANLQVAYIGPHSQMSIINGSVSSIQTYRFNVTPRQLGEFTIPSIRAQVDGQNLVSSALKLNVIKPGSSVPSNSGEELALVRLVLPKKEIFVGEIIQAELQVLLHSSVQNLANFQPPTVTAEGFNVGRMAETGRSRVQVGNSVYTQFSVAIVLTPVKTGSFNVGPIGTRFVIELATPNRRRDPFDPFGVFNRNEQREVTLATEAVPVEVLPLPAGAPEGFTGAVGRYTMAFNAGPTNLAVGDPITLRIQISGRGNLDALALPERTDWQDFKTYPPTAKVETTDPLGTEGAKTFEEIVTPQNTDIKALPPISFAYFDPDQKAYRQITQPAIPLTVRPGGSVPAPTIAGTRNGNTDKPPTQDIVPIKQRIGAIATPAPALIRQPWFLALQSVPLLAFAAAIFWRRRRELLANNPRLRRQRAVAQIVRDGLNELHHQAAANNSDAFFATVFRLLQEQLGERLDVPAASITEAVIDERLRPRGAPEAAVTALHELFQMCNLARYAPIKSSQELAAIIPRVESALNQLREVRV